jgi:hypothetical protein
MTVNYVKYFYNYQYNTDYTSSIFISLDTHVYNLYLMSIRNVENRF